MRREHPGLSTVIFFASITFLLVVTGGILIYQEIVTLTVDQEPFPGGGVLLISGSFLCIAALFFGSVAFRLFRHTKR